MSDANKPLEAFGLALAVLVALAFAPALGAGFVFDDVLLLVNTDCYHGLSRIPEFFADPYDACDYRPMRYVTYAVDYTIAGTAPWIYHLTNILFHIGSVWLGWLVLGRLAGWRSADRAPQITQAAMILAAAVLLFYGLHPVQADAVVPAAGRRDVQSTFLFLAALWAWLKRRDGRAPVWIGLSVVLWGLALLTKEMAVTLPAVILLAEVTAPGLSDEPPSARLKALMRRTWPVWVLLGAVTVAFVLYRGVFVSHSNMAGRWWGGSFGSNLFNIILIQGQYAAMILWPQTLVGDYAQYTVPLAEGLADVRVWWGLLVMAVVVAAAVMSLSKRPLVTLGLGWTAVTLAPVSHIIPHHEFMAEHFLHLPLMGLALALYGALEPWVGKASDRRRAWMLGAALVVVMALTVRLELRLEDYSDEESFGWAVVNAAPTNVRGLGRLASFYTDDAEVRDHYAAEKLNWIEWCTSPPGTVYRSASAQRLARIYAQRYNDPQRAEAFLLFNLAQHDDAELRRALAQLYMQEDQPQAAAPLWERLANEGSKSAMVELGFVHLMQGQPARAVAVAQKVLAQRPKSPKALYLLAVALVESGKPKEAFEALGRCLEVAPQHTGALQMMAQMLCGIGQQPQAIEVARRALATSPDDGPLQALVASIEAGPCPQPQP